MGIQAKGGRPMTTGIPDRTGSDDLGIDPAGSYRVLDEAKTVLAIAHHGRPLDVQQGGRSAEQAVTDAARSVERWVEQGLPHRQAGGRRFFDFFETLNFMVRAGQVRGDRWYASGPVATFRRSAAALQDVAESERFEVRFRREFRLEPGATGRLRVPLPLDDPALTDLDVELIEPRPNSVESSGAPGRLEVRIPPPDRPGSVAVEVVIRFRTAGRSHSLDHNVFNPWDTADPEYRLYTQANEGMIQVDDGIRQLAENLAPGSPRPWEALRAFWDFFFTRMSSGRIHHDEQDPGSRLNSIVAGGWFDCLAGSSLLAGLCRARGIPARVVNGLTLYEAIPSNHYWTEVLIPPFGWLGFDLASWDLAAGNRLDRRWSEHYFGQVDARMTYQRFPRQILGPPGVRFPQAWYSLPAVRDGGLETTYLERDSGALLFRDWIKVQREPCPGTARVPQQ